MSLPQRPYLTGHPVLQILNAFSSLLCLLQFCYLCFVQTFPISPWIVVTHVWSAQTMAEPSFQLSVSASLILHSRPKVQRYGPLDLSRFILTLPYVWPWPQLHRAMTWNTPLPFPLALGLHLPEHNGSLVFFHSFSKVHSSFIFFGKAFLDARPGQCSFCALCSLCFDPCHTATASGTVSWRIGMCLIDL